MNEKIFVSYNRHDSEFALKLADDLVNQGINIWIDQRNISPGFRWDQELEKALSSSEVVLVILSPFSVASENVLDEVSFAIDAQKRIIPIIAKQCNIPLRLKRFQYIEFNLNYSGGLSRLIAELKKDAPLPPPAPEPDDGKHDDLDIDKKKKSKILKYILVGVFLIIAILIIWLLTNNQRQPGTEIKPYQPEQINVACNASPNKIPAGGETELRVKVYAEQGNPLANANVRIEMGGGRFSTSGKETEIGTTDVNGIYETVWRSPEPGAAGYGVSVTVNKEGFIEGKCATRIDIETSTINRGPAARSSISEQINVTCSANPYTIPAGEQAVLSVLASTPKGTPISDAIVRLEMGGGWFSVSGTSTEIGLTNANGVFVTKWRSPKPAAARYGVSVTASKEGFIEGKSETTIQIGN